MADYLGEGYLPRVQRKVLTLTKLIGFFNARFQIALYDLVRQGKEGAISRVHLNYLHSESLEGFSWSEPEIMWLCTTRLGNEKSPAPIFPLPMASSFDGWVSPIRLFFLTAVPAQGTCSDGTTINAPFCVWDP